MTLLRPLNVARFKAEFLLGERNFQENVLGLDQNFVLIRKNGSSLKAGGL